MTEKPVWRRDLKWRQLFVRPPLLLPPLQPHSSGLPQRQAQTTAKCASCLLYWLGCVSLSHSISLLLHITFLIEIQRNLPIHPKRTQFITEFFSDFSFSQVCFELANTSNQLKRWIGNARSSGTGGCLSQCYNASLLLLFFLAHVTHQMSTVSLSLSRGQTDAVSYVSMCNTMPC